MFLEAGPVGGVEVFLYYELATQAWLRAELE